MNHQPWLIQAIPGMEKAIPGMDDDPSHAGTTSRGPQQAGNSNGRYSGAKNAGHDNHQYNDTVCAISHFIRIANHIFIYDFFSSE